MLNEKLARLNELLGSLNNAVIAFSGGVDSTFLAAAAYKVLGARAATVTACSESLSAKEQAEAISIANFLGIKHFLLPTHEFSNTQFIANTYKRCYFCKKERFTGLAEWAGERGFSWILEGTNVDDSRDFRPGMRAIAEISMVKSPLAETGFTKADIRAVSKMWGLPTWNKLSKACMVSRLAYGLEITPMRLRQVEQAEELIEQFCTGQVRVRHHGDLARIEVETVDINAVTDGNNIVVIVNALTELGFTYVTVDLAGYRTGSMNEVLDEVEKYEYQ